MLSPLNDHTLKLSYLYVINITKPGKNIIDRYNAFFKVWSVSRDKLHEDIDSDNEWYSLLRSIVITNWCFYIIIFQGLKWMSYSRN